MKSAASLEKGNKSRIQEFCNDKMTGRFLDLGILPGSEIEMIGTTTFKGTFYLKINHHFFALRKEELEAILLEN